MIAFQIPADLKEYPIVDLQLSRRARNALLKQGYEKLVDLDGIPIDAIRALRGVGAGTILEIEREIPYMALTSATLGGIAPNGAVSDGKEAPAIPEALRDTPISRLALPWRTSQAITELHIETLGHLSDPECTGGSWSRIEPRHIKILIEQTERLLALPLYFLRDISHRGERGEILIPRLDLSTIERLSAALCLDDEVRALVSGLGERNSGFVLSRWCYHGWERPGLEELGADQGLTRERVRQIVSQCESELGRSGLRLPIGTAYVEALERAGGVLALEQFRKVLAATGLPMDGQPLYSLPYLAALELIPPVRYSRQLRLWLSPSGESRYGTEELFSLVMEARGKVRKQLSRRNSIAIERLEVLSPFGADHMLRLARADASDFVEVSGFVIPLPTRDSPIIAAVDKTLAVTSSLSLSSLYRGLRRAPRLRVPPQEAMKVILEQHGRYLIEDERIRSRTPIRRERVLSGSELLGVQVMEEHGSLMTQQAFLDAVVEGGYSIPMANVLLRSPFMRRVSTGVYALRGKAIDPETVRGTLRARRDSRGERVMSARWVGDRLVVRYHLTSFSREGVLTQPRELSAVVPVWRSRYPDGLEGVLKMRNGFLWSIRDWISRTTLREGDLLIATFYPAEQVVEWDSVSAQEHP